MLIFTGRLILGLMNSTIEQIRALERDMTEADALKGRLADQRACLIDGLIAELGSIKEAACALGVTRQAIQKARTRLRKLREPSRKPRRRTFRSLKKQG